MFERQFQNEIYTFDNWNRYLIRTLFEPAITQLLESARIFMIAFNLEEL